MENDNLSWHINMAELHNGCQSRDKVSKHQVRTQAKTDLKSKGSQGSLRRAVAPTSAACYAHRKFREPETEGRQW